ncbi:MAG: prepilin-type N-terminal cleavage/methylation domain-containing protein [Gemmatimonadaceae bacterium]|nr:prepilin-type N-terminal cleavage/methylation domain-containing protein [Gemmatimonadaceae bacterium]
MTRQRPFHRLAALRARAGISLVEIVVACTILAVALTAITGITVKLAARNRRVAYAEERTAVFFQEVNRAESMPYDSLSVYLRTDSIKSGNDWYVFAYTLDPDSSSATNSSGHGQSVYKKITLVVTPRADTSAHAQTAVIRRFKAPAYNPLYNQNQ